MQLRETKLTPMANGKTLVELTYSDHEEEARATNRLRLQCDLELGSRTSVAGVQREALLSLFEWIRGETERLNTLRGA